MPGKQSQNLSSALKAVYGSDVPPLAAAVLMAAVSHDEIGFEEIQAIAGSGTEELLLFAWSLKLLLPRMFSRCGEWDDRIVRIEPGETYEMPNISRYLVKCALTTAKWDVRAAVSTLYRDMGEPEWSKMSDLVDEICRRAVNCAISASAISAACSRASISGSTGAMIAVLKGGGIISPKLRPVGPVIKAAVPLYEINPGVCPDDCSDR